MKSVEQQVKEAWNLAMGTPKSLDQAVSNAVDELFQKNFTMEEIAPMVTKHVKDFLSQKFTYYMSGDATSGDLVAQAIWESIMGIKK